LIARDVGNTRLKECLGDGENAFATEFLPVAEVKLQDFFGEQSFCHESDRQGLAQPKTGRHARGFAGENTLGLNSFDVNDTARCRLY